MTAVVKVPLALLADSYSVGEPFTFTPAVGDLVWLSERKPSLWLIGRLLGLTRPAMTFAVVHSRPVPRPSGRLAIETEDGRWMFAELSALHVPTCQLDDLIAYENTKRGEP